MGVCHRQQHATSTAIEAVLRRESVLASHTCTSSAAPPCPAISSRQGAARSSRARGRGAQVAWVSWAQLWLTAGDDGTLRCWSAADGRQLKDIACPGARTQRSSTSRMRARAALQARARTCTDVSRGAARAGAGGAVQALLLDEANRLALVATSDRRLRAWDLAAGAPLASYAGHADCVRALGYLPDKARPTRGRRAAVARRAPAPCMHRPATVHASRGGGRLITHRAASERGPRKPMPCACSDRIAMHSSLLCAQRRSARGGASPRVP